MWRNLVSTDHRKGRPDGLVLAVIKGVIWTVKGGNFEYSYKTVNLINCNNDLHVRLDHRTKGTTDVMGYQIAL